MNEISQNSFPQQHIARQTTTPPLTETQPIPIQREMTPQQAEEMCGSFHDHSVRYVPSEIMRSMATYFYPNWRTEDNHN